MTCPPYQGTSAQSRRVGPRLCSYPGIATAAPGLLTSEPPYWRPSRPTGFRAALQLDPDRLGLEVGVQVGVALLAADARCLVAAERGCRVAAAPGVDVDVAS